MHVDAIPLRLKIDDYRVIAFDERDEMVEVVIETVHPNACCPDCGFDDHPALGVAWTLAWDMKRIYAAPGRTEAAIRLHRFCEDAEESGLVVFAELIQTFRAWETEILGHFESRLTNGYAEGITNKIKVIKRRAYGCPNFDSFRRRVLLACG